MWPNLQNGYYDPNLQQNYRNREFLEERAILYLDTVCKATMNYNTMENMCATEFLSNMIFPGIPIHELKLKVGLQVMLL